MESLVRRLVTKELDVFNLTIEKRYGISLSAPGASSHTKVVKMVVLKPPPLLKKPKRPVRPPPKSIFAFIESKRTSIQCDRHDAAHVVLDSGIVVNVKKNIAVGKMFSDKLVDIDAEDKEMCRELNLYHV